MQKKKTKKTSDIISALFICWEGGGEGEGRKWAGGGRGEGGGGGGGGCVGVVQAVLL